jgi:hypothetical protein
VPKISHTTQGGFQFVNIVNNTTMAAHAPRLARLFSPTFARAINAQIVYPATSQVVKPNELESALAKPLHKAYYQPESSAAELAASLSYGIIKGSRTHKINCLL